MSTESERPTSWLGDRIGWAGVPRRRSASTAPRAGASSSTSAASRSSLLLVQVASGILLLLHYRPDVTQAARARSSADHRTRSLRGTWSAASTLWAGDLFVAASLARSPLHRRHPPELQAPARAHLAERPRRRWSLGVGLAFTGAILPWSEEAYTHARAGSELARFVPVHRRRRCAGSCAAATR